MINGLYASIFPHSTRSLPPVGLIHPPTPFLLCFSSPSAQLVEDELWGWLVRRSCSRAGRGGHRAQALGLQCGPDTSQLHLPVCSLSKPGTVGWAGDQSIPQCFREVPGRDTQCLWGTD